MRHRPRLRETVKRSEVLKLAEGMSQDPTEEGVATALKEAGLKPGSQYLTELELLHVAAGDRRVA